MIDDTARRGVSRVIGILRTIAASQEGGLRVSEISSELGLSYSATRRLLHALIAEHAVEMSPDDKRYRIGREITLLGLARTHHSELIRCAVPHMRRLVHDFKETVYLTVRSQADSVCIRREVGTSDCKVLSINEGSRRPLGIVIGSIAYLAALDEPEFRHIICENHTRYSHWGLDSTRVTERVQFARNHGYAYAKIGLRAGTSSLAAVIRNSQGCPIGALSIAAVSKAMDASRVETISGALIQHANEVGAASPGLHHQVSPRVTS